LVWLQKQNPRPGILFLTYAALTSAAQILIQGFRGDSVLIGSGLRQGQILAWLALASLFVLFEYRLKQNVVK
jgi:prolipoprotein diacylglyceryltransferase